VHLWAHGALGPHGNLIYGFAFAIVVKMRGLKFEFYEIQRRENIPAKVIDRFARIFAGTRVKKTRMPMWREAFRPVPGVVTALVAGWRPCPVALGARFLLPAVT
jgi:hypothetical protein